MSYPMKARHLGTWALFGVSLSASVVLLLAWILLTPLYIAFFGPATAAVLLLAALFLPKISLGTVPLPPERVLASLGYRLRLEGFQVQQAPGELIVRLGTYAATKLRVRGTRDGSETLYQAFATSSGWGTLIFLLVIVWTAVAAFPLIAYLWYRASSFATRRAGPLLEDASALREIPRPDDIAAALLEGLAEGHRLASDAYDATRTTYYDLLAIVLFLAFATWGLFVVFLFLGLADWEPTARIRAASLLSILPGAILAVIPMWYLRRRYRPSLLRHRFWAGRLQEAFNREALRRSPEAAEPSAFELLAEASQELPTWLEAVRRAGVSADPAAGFLLLVLLLGAWSVLSAAWGWTNVSGSFAALLGTSGVVLAVAAFVFYRRWRIHRDAELNRIRDEWRRRFAELRTRMDRFLQDL